MGSIGGLPAAPGQAINASIIGPTRMSTPEQFRNILLRVNPDGSQVRIGDVARVASQFRKLHPRHQVQRQARGRRRHPPRGRARTRSTPSRASTRRSIASRHSSRAASRCVYPLDTTPFVRTSIKEVVKTLFEAVVLVFLVMYLFLQNARATLIPTIAVPVVLLGTFGILAAFGFSINTLTMFGMALSIGLLVDDAIVVVENVERVMAEEGLSPREATRKSMDQITGALVAIALVLAAVFVPMAFFGGSIGVIYRQFSITLVSAMCLSVLVALILTPALCATILKPLPPSGHVEHKGFFKWFNQWFDRGRDKHDTRPRRRCWRAPAARCWCILAIVVVIGLLFTRIPTSFLPNEDPGFMYGQVQTPPGASKERTWAALDKAQQYLIEQEKDIVEGVLTVNGFNFAGTGQNSGLLFIKLKDWDERNRRLAVDAGAAGAHQQVSSPASRRRTSSRCRRRRCSSSATPPASTSCCRIAAACRATTSWPRATSCWARPRRIRVLAGVRPNGVEDAPQFKLDIDREKASALGVSDRRHQPDAADRLGVHLRERLHRPRPREARVRAGRSAVAHAAGGSESLVRAQQPGRHGAVLGLRPRRMDLRSAEADCVSTACRPTRSRARRRRVAARARPWTPWKKSSPNYPQAWASSGTACRTRKRNPARRRRCCTRCRWPSSSCAWRRLYESWSIPVTVLLVVPLGVLGAVIATLGARTHQ